MAKKTKNKIDWRIVCTGLICISALEAYALSVGINGTLLKVVLIVIGGVIGVSIPNPFKQK